MEKRILAVSLALLLLFSFGNLLAEEVAQAVFAVHCYDVGSSALEGRRGVLAVEKGWRGGREINSVLFDPRLVDARQLEQWLQEAGTYGGTLEEMAPVDGEKN